MYSNAVGARRDDSTRALTGLMFRQFSYATLDVGGISMSDYVSGNSGYSGGSGYSGSSGGSGASGAGSSGGPGEATFESQMQQQAAQSREDSIIETQTNVQINQNNAVAQTSAGVGRE
jgi:hypothetical protein